MQIMNNTDYSGKKIFPELPDDVPNELLNEDWANKIHLQTLKRLQEMGGLSIIEMIMNLSKITSSKFFETYGYNYKPTTEDAKELLRLIKIAEIKNASK
jgi:hypothetical protein